MGVPAFQREHEQEVRPIARALLRALFFWVAAALWIGCGGSAYDPSTGLGKRAILDSVSLKLSEQDCRAAIAQIKPLYNSENTDNEVRMMAAAAYGCAANVDMFKLLNDMVSAGGGVFSGGGFWSFLAKQFPSVATDDRAEGGLAAQDALLAVIDPGWAVLQNNLFNIDTFNPGAYNVNSRKAMANAYLFFIAMSSIGALESRYGVPDANGHPTTTPPLPWVTAAQVTLDGCAYASSLVNFVDSLGSLAGNVPGTFASTFTSLKDTFGTAIFTACDQGCTNPLIAGCALSSCAECPLVLRNRTSCTGVATDAASCAAAGIVNMINTPGLGWN